MRFVAGRGAVAELLLAWAPWRRAIGNQLLPRRCGGAPEERRRYGGAIAGQGAAAELHREANKRTQKEKGPEETLISLPSRFYLLSCERATRHATRPNRRSPLAFTAGMQCRRSCRRHAVLAKLPLQLCRDCKEGCSKCKNCVELWEYGKDKGVTEYVLSV